MTLLRWIFSLRGGVWIWGIVLFLWLLAIIIGLAGQVRHCPATVRLYAVIHANNTLLSAITAVLGVVWSWFIQLRFNEVHEVPKAKAKNDKVAEALKALGEAIKVEGE